MRNKRKNAQTKANQDLSSYIKKTFSQKLRIFSRNVIKSVTNHNDNRLFFIYVKFKKKSTTNKLRYPVEQSDMRNLL